MDLAGLHRAVRALAKGTDATLPEHISEAERQAFRAFQRRLARVGGDISKLAYPSGDSGWFVPARTSLDPAK